KFLYGSPDLLHEGGVAQRQAMAIYLPLYANACARFKIDRLAQEQALFASCSHDGIGKWMLATLIEASCQPQYFGGVPARRCHCAVVGWLAFCERTRLVHDQRVDLTHAFDGCSIPEQDTLSGPLSGGHHD